MLFLGIAQYHVPQEKLQTNQNIVAANVQPNSIPSKIPPYQNPSLQKFCLPNFLYPQSSLLFENNKNALIESANDISSVADWYTNQLQNQNYSITNTVQNTTNGNSAFLLGGEKNNLSISIALNNTGSKTSIFLEVNQC